MGYFLDLNFAEITMTLGFFYDICYKGKTVGLKFFLMLNKVQIQAPHILINLKVPLLRILLKIALTADLLNGLND